MFQQAPSTAWGEADLKRKAANWSPLAVFFMPSYIVVGGEFAYLPSHPLYILSSYTHTLLHSLSQQYYPGLEEKLNPKLSPKNIQTSFHTVFTVCCLHTLQRWEVNLRFPHTLLYGPRRSISYTPVWSWYTLHSCILPAQSILSWICMCAPFLASNLWNSWQMAAWAGVAAGIHWDSASPSE